MSGNKLIRHISIQNAHTLHNRLSHAGYVQAFHDAYGEKLGSKTLLSQYLRREFDNLSTFHIDVLNKEFFNDICEHLGDDPEFSGAKNDRPLCSDVFSTSTSDIYINGEFREIRSLYVSDEYRFYAISNQGIPLHKSCDLNRINKNDKGSLIYYGVNESHFSKKMIPPYHIFKGMSKNHNNIWFYSSKGNTNIYCTVTSLSSDKDIKILEIAEVDHINIEGLTYDWYKDIKPNNHNRVIEYSYLPHLSYADAANYLSKLISIAKSKGINFDMVMLRSKDPNIIPNLKLSTKLKRLDIEKHICDWLDAQSVLY